MHSYRVIAPIFLFPFSFFRNSSALWIHVPYVIWLLWCGVGLLHKRRQRRWNACRTLQLGPSFTSVAGNQRPLPGESFSFSLASQPCLQGVMSLAQHSFKAIRGLHPPYLWSLFTLTSATHGHCTRQASTVSVHYLRPRTNFGKRPSATVVLPPGTLCQTTLTLHPPFLLINP